MEIDNFIDQDSILLDLKSSSKRQALMELSKHMADNKNLSDREIFNVLLEREKLGSTGIGRGIAIPHGKLKGLDRICGCFVRLNKPIDFESIDKKPVDLIFLLLAPEDSGVQHLKALALMSRIMGKNNFCNKLRSSESAESIFSLLTKDQAQELPRNLK